MINAQLMVQCEECNMWRFVYSKYKLSVAKCHQLQQLLNDHSYSCGAKLQDLHLGDDVEIRDHACGDTIKSFTIQLVLNPYVFIVAVISHSLHLSSTHNANVHIILLSRNKCVVCCLSLILRRYITCTVGCGLCLILIYNMNYE